MKGREESIPRSRASKLKGGTNDVALKGGEEGRGRRSKRRGGCFAQHVPFAPPSPAGYATLAILLLANLGQNQWLVVVVWSILVNQLLSLCVLLVVVVGCTTLPWTALRQTSDRSPRRQHTKFALLLTRILLCSGLPKPPNPPPLPPPPHSPQSPAPFETFPTLPETVPPSKPVSLLSQ